MKYHASLFSLIAVAAALTLSGCGGDLTREHDIYRNEYKYKPVVQKEAEPNLPPAQPPAPAAPAM